MPPTAAAMPITLSFSLVRFCGPEVTAVKPALSPGSDNLVLTRSSSRSLVTFACRGARPGTAPGVKAPWEVL